jgi:serine/threonine protein kinase
MAASKFPRLHLADKTQHSCNSLKVILGERFPLFDWKELTEFGESIGRGSFGAVFLAKYKQENVVIKKLISDEDNDKKLFMKEARVLRRLEGEHIVQMKAACVDPCAIMLEYIYFDFTHFGSDFKVSSLDAFLKFIDKNKSVNDFQVHNKIATDTSKALRYLHQRGIVHRDIKPANILVSNEHYRNLKNVDRIQEAWINNPIICKLADFGESRSQVVQTTSICNTATSNIVRGTPVYRAPEIFSNDKDSLTIENLKAVDMWALGMVFFVLLNPDLSYPYQRELTGVIKPLETLTKLVKSGRHPQHSEKYAPNQATEWISIWRMYERCTRYNPNDREKIESLVKSLEKKDSIRCVDIALSVSQNSALEKASLEAAKRKRHCGSAGIEVPDDGSNSCSFLSVHFAHKLIQSGNKVCTIEETSGDTWKNMAELAEGVIKTTPVLINHHRNISCKYDVMEAYQLFRSIKILQTEYDFMEQIISGDGVYSAGGRRSLLEAVHEVYSADSLEVGIYTCGEYIFTIGCLHGQYLIMDTHAMDKELGGNGGSGLLKVFCYDKESSRWVCEWIWKRMRQVNVKSNSLQSLALMKRQR